MAKPTRIGIDTGGTFTDLAILRDDSIAVHKLPSTPDDPARAVLDGLAAVRDGREPVDVVHGTTVGLNAMLTGRHARTAFVTNRGFRDLVEVGRQQRDVIYELSATKAEFPVPRQLRFEVGSRRNADGSVSSRPTATELRALRDAIANAEVDSIAIGLLHAYLAPSDERRIAAALAPLGVPITCSAELLPSPGEFERFTAAAINAAIGPIVGAYLARVEQGIGTGRLRLMRSSGGAMSAAEAHEFPARALLSGPAGGIVACSRLAESLGTGRVATLDMGGTSTDVGLVGTSSEVVAATRVAGLPLATPSVDLHTIGCGGGSIAHVDAGGALRVGPASAGADPGPACYGVGDEPTVTDAHVVLGNIGPSTLLGGAFGIDPDRAWRAIERLGRRVGLDAERCARGILEVAEIAMVRALLVMTVERRIDPATVPLVAFGGAGGLHAAGLIQRLGMPRAIVPEHPGAFSAVGLALAGESHEAVHTVLRPLHELARGELARIVRDTGRAARAGLDGRGRATATNVLLRYAGQGGGLWLDAGPRLAERFAEVHQHRFGFRVDDRPIEVVRVETRATTGGAPLPRSRGPRGRSAEPSLRRAGRAVFHRDSISLGSTVEGPALVEEQTSVVVVPRGFRARRSDVGIELAPHPS